MLQNCFGLRPCHNCGQRGYVRLFYCLQAAEVFQEATSSGFADAGDLA